MDPTGSKVQRAVELGRLAVASRGTEMGAACLREFHMVAPPEWLGMFPAGVKSWRCPQCGAWSLAPSESDGPMFRCGCRQHRHEVVHALLAEMEQLDKEADTDLREDPREELESAIERVLSRYAGEEVEL